MDSMEELSCRRVHPQSGSHARNRKALMGPLVEGLEPRMIDKGLIVELQPEVAYGCLRRKGGILHGMANSSGWDLVSCNEDNSRA